MQEFVFDGGLVELRVFAASPAQIEPMIPKPMTATVVSSIWERVPDPVQMSNFPSARGGMTMIGI